MRIFCPEHNRGFFAPRQNPIRCENRGHVLGELDFEGEAQPAEVRWQYCCNCEHFCPTALGQDLIQRCPVCARQTSLRYLCDRCYTISFESNTPAQTKNFTLTPEGTPQPACPACLQSAGADLREHICDALGVTFITVLGACPICNERLDIAPAFPCPVSYYLKRTKAGNKLNVTFDYASGLFVRVEDGEFVLIPNGHETTPIVLPRFPRFNSRRHFYDFYQDYYCCANPGAGEVQIIQPAAVEQVSGGWTLTAPGVLEVLGPQTNGNAPASLTPNLAGPSPPKLGPSKEKTREQCESTLVACPHCDSLVETKYAFCWNCGELISGHNEPSITRVPQRSNLPAAAVSRADDEPTSEHYPVHPGPAIFSWAMQEAPDRTPSGSHAALKLIALVLVGVLLVSVGLFVLLPWALRTNPTWAGQAAKQDLQNSASAASDAEDSPATKPAEPQTSVQSEDQALNRIRERRDTADRSAMLSELEAAEKQYPKDYRFPYERAKLSINAQEVHAHHDAFAALLLAAEKAINSGKADEMLSSLEADREGDLRKLSRGHGEWKQLERALKNSDGSMLSTKTHQ